MEVQTEVPQLTELDKPYQVLNHLGELVDTPPDLSAEKLLGLHRAMLMTRAMSDKVIALQRQGRAGTFGTLTGQEAAAVGLAAPLLPQDWLTTSYREVGSHMVKGVKAEEFIYTLKGYPPKTDFTRTNCLPIQIVIGTQMLHAVGLAMAAKIKGDDAVAVGVCGDGATSEGDVNEALNFAGVFKSPAIIVFINNGWAISMPRRKQSAVPQLAARGAGFGVPSYVVDGNDILAMYKVMSQVVDRARAGGGPSLIEAMTYRMGAHTTADDPTRYMPKEELDYWKARDPIARFRQYLAQRQILDEAGEKAMLEEIEKELNEAVEKVEAEEKATGDHIFDITFEKPTTRMEQQRAIMRRELGI